MPPRQEKLGHDAAVKGTMLQAHLGWAAQRLGADWKSRLRLEGEPAVIVERSVLATDWIPFSCLVAIDRAIAAAAGGPPDRVYSELGRHSATTNLAGAYKAFVQDEPHRFFEQMALLHGRFQNFGRCVYERSGPRAGRIRIEGYQEYSPVFCASGSGYYEGALQMMHVPGPIACAEVACQCAGEPACVYDLSW